MALTSRGSIRVVSNDDSDRALVYEEISRRYGPDYDVAAFSDPDAALEELRRVASIGGQVALVLACQHGNDDGVAFLARVRAIMPSAKRAVVNASNASRSEIKTARRPSTPLDCSYSSDRNLTRSGSRQR